MGKGNSPNSRNGCHREFSVPGAFKLDHLQPLKPILFPKFSNYYLHFYTGEPKGQLKEKIRPVAQGIELPVGFFPATGLNSYYPRERKADNGKMEFSQPE